MKHAFNVGLPDKKASRKRSKTRRGSQKQRQAVMRELPVKTIVTRNPWERWSLGKRDYGVRLKNCAMRKGAMLNKLCRVRAANEPYTYRVSLLRFRTKTRKKGIGKDRQKRTKLAKGRQKSTKRERERERKKKSQRRRRETRKRTKKGERKIKILPTVGFRALRERTFPAERCLFRPATRAKINIKGKCVSSS